MFTLIHKYSLFNMINEYNKNKPLIDAYLKKYPIEQYDPSNPFPVGIFVVALAINLILFIVALVLLIKRWKNLPTWAQVVSLISLLISMPVITIMIVLVA